MKKQEINLAVSGDASLKPKRRNPNGKKVNLSVDMN